MNYNTSGRFRRFYLKESVCIYCLTAPQLLVHSRNHLCIQVCLDASSSSWLQTAKYAGHKMSLH